MPAYHSAYRAEAWDLNCKHGPTDRQDSHIYWAAYCETRSQRKLNPGDTYTVLDVGTGGGRIMWDIATHAVEAGFEPRDTRYIGIDTSEHMLERARHLIPKGLATQVSLVHGSAIDLQKATPTKVDLLTFATGSISHLWEPGHAESFFHEVAKILRPNTGKAYISLLNELSGDEDETSTEISNKNLSPTELERASESFPNVFYRQEYGMPRAEGNLLHLPSTLVVVEKGSDGKEKVVETDSTTAILRHITENVLIRMAKDAGLGLVDKVEWGAQVVYVLNIAS